MTITKLQAPQIWVAIERPIGYSKDHGTGMLMTCSYCADPWHLKGTDTWNYKAQ